MNKEFDLKLTEQELIIVFNSLSKESYSTVFNLINNIQFQLKQQTETNE